MKVQLGLLNFEERPVTLDDLSRISGEWAAYPAEISGEVCEGPFFMVYRGNRITPEEDYETQPLRQGDLVMTWDGRLDNRAEVASRAHLSEYRNMPDSEIVLKAYQLFGDCIFNNMIGEFALAVWRRGTRTLQFARSACGARTLYYVLTNDSVIWSSDFAHLVRVSGADLKVNDEYVFDYFVCEPDVKQTALAAVQAAAPNRVLTFENGRVRSARELWDPTRLAPLRYRDDREYEEDCRERIKDAVKVRIPSRGSFFAELSGGLDSSTIALFADEILREGNGSADRLHTVSCVYDESKTCDEQGYISAITAKRGIETHLIQEQVQRFTLGLAEDPPFTGLPNPLDCLPGRYETITQVMQEHGARLLLTGIGGDHLFLSEPDGAPLVADDLRAANLLRAHRECSNWSRVTCVPYYEVAKKSLRLFFESVFPGDTMYRQPDVPKWINLTKGARPLSPLVDFDRYPGWRSAPSQRARVFLIDRLFRCTGSGFVNGYRGLYVSHPFSHRPLIEFCLRTPTSQFLRNGATRALMRRALSSLLPPKNANRVSKGLIDETLVRAIRREWHSIGDLKRWQVCQREYVNGEELERALNRVRTGFLDLSGSLFRLFTLERWLRSLSQVSHLVSATEANVSRPPFSFRLDYGIPELPPSFGAN